MNTVKENLRRYRMLLGVASIVAGIATIVLPVGVFFSNYTPPLFPPISFVSAGVSAAVLLSVLSQDRGLKQSAARGGVWLLLAITASSLYLLAYRFWTASPPTGRVGTDYQVGFALANWSLTAEARDWIAENPTQSYEDLMLAFGAYGNSGTGPELIWQGWSIAAAGALLIFLFTLSLLCWSFAMSNASRVFKLMRASSADDIFRALTI